MAVKKNTLLIVAGSLLILLLIGVTILLISEKQTNKELRLLIQAFTYQ